MLLPGSVEAALKLAISVSLHGREPPAEATQRARALASAARALLPDRQRSAVESLLLGPSVEQGLDWFQRAGLLEAVLPEMAATVGFVQEGGRRHKDVWKHTRRVVAQTPPVPILRWAALLHDVGKVSTRRTGASGKVTFHGHAEAGSKIFFRISRRLDFPESTANAVGFLILHHLRAAQYEADWTDSAVRRFARQLSPYLPELLQLSRADMTSARPEKIAAARQRLEELARRIEALRVEDERVEPLPRGIGEVLMTAFELRPGVAVGELKRALLEAIERGELRAEQPPPYYVEYLLRRLERPRARGDGADGEGI